MNRGYTYREGYRSISCPGQMNKTKSLGSEYVLKHVELIARIKESI